MAHDGRHRVEDASTRISSFQPSNGILEEKRDTAVIFGDVVNRQTYLDIKKIK